MVLQSPLARDRPVSELDGKPVPPFGIDMNAGS